MIRNDHALTGNDRSLIPKDRALIPKGPSFACKRPSFMSKGQMPDWQRLGVVSESRWVSRHVDVETCHVPRQVSKGRSFPERPSLDLKNLYPDLLGSLAAKSARQGV